MTAIPTPMNRLGQFIVPGPYIPSTGTCMWCSQPLVMDGETYRSTTTGRGRCSPADRSARCAWAFYREQGIDPLTLSGHDGACSCQFSIDHVPASGSSTPYPHQDRIPYHHSQPARLTATHWVCRERTCMWMTAPGPVEAERPRDGYVLPAELGGFTGYTITVDGVERMIDAVRVTRGAAHVTVAGPLDSGLKPATLTFTQAVEVHGPRPAVR